VPKPTISAPSPSHKHVNFFAHEPFSRGALLAETDILLRHKPHQSSAIVVEDGSVYSIPREAFVHFLDRNPGVKLNFINTFFAEARQVPHSLHRILSNDEFDY
jgi:CRP-like cAMP-binding protein